MGDVLAWCSETVASESPLSGVSHQPKLAGLLGMYLAEGGCLL